MSLKQDTDLRSSTDKKYTGHTDNTKVADISEKIKKFSDSVKSFLEGSQGGDTFIIGKQKKYGNAAKEKPTVNTPTTIQDNKPKKNK